MYEYYTPYLVNEIIKCTFSDFNKFKNKTLYCSNYLTNKIYSFGNQQ